MKRRYTELLERAPRRAGLLPICRISRQHAAQWWAASEPVCYMSVLPADLYDRVDHFFVTDELFLPLDHKCTRAKELHTICVLRQLDSCEWHARLPCMNQVNHIGRAMPPPVFIARVERSGGFVGPHRMTLVAEAADGADSPWISNVVEVVKQQLTDSGSATYAYGRIHFHLANDRKTAEQIVEWLRDAGLVVKHGWPWFD